MAEAWLGEERGSVMDYTTSEHTVDRPCKTDTEIAREMGITRGRVRQIRMRAMEKIRAAIIADSKLRRFVEDELEIRVS